MKNAVLLVGHGSRRSEANEGLNYLQTLVEQKRPGQLVATAFLQLAEPDVATAIADLVAREIEKIIIVPVFLYEGVHIKEDFPEILTAAKTAHPELELLLAPIMGFDERMAAVIWDRVGAVADL